MNGSVMAATTPRKAYAGKLVLDGLDVRHAMRGPLARYDALFGSLVAIGIIIGLVPAGKKGPEVRPWPPSSSFTPLVETLRGLLTGPPSAGPVVMAITGCAGLSLLGCLWVRARFAARA
ncbi:hypothetical protein MF672_016090 [Actinomadura sp. ATCC 31491]|uniref:ABC transporter permease n=1 Tax=Actinomadura luzonensis TaxID=2805427 RepID=A0ABT0FT10_9ACTN|nr:hypothetical protein [Actinomadura luzonensis]MCK2215298.1 hypothetical protein [Actinomadura luzonensis]